MCGFWWPSLVLNQGISTVVVFHSTMGLLYIFLVSLNLLSCYCHALLYIYTSSHLTFHQIIVSKWWVKLVVLLHRGEYIHEHSNILGRIICVALHVLFFSSFIVYVIKSNIPLLRALSVISFEQLECGSNFCNSGHPPRKLYFNFIWIHPYQE